MARRAAKAKTRGGRATRPEQTAPATRRLAALVVTLLAIAATGIAAWWWRQPARFAIAIASERNVLLVTIDTLRADAIGAYGGGAATPHLDRLAASGARFSFAHAHAVTTLPSHASLLTGRYPYEHGIRDNTGYRLEPDEQTLATRFRSRGYATGAFVGGFPLNQRFGLNAGFGTYDDRIGDVIGRDLTIPERRADAVVGSALSWTDAQPGRWFGWVHVFDPHSPYRAPDEWRARYPSDPYLAEVAWTDAALGRLFDRLRAAVRPTLVIVTADHGESLGDHGELTHSLFAYEATLRVPLIVAELGADRAPSRGLVIDAPVRHVDVAPTLLEAIGAPAEQAMSGASLVPVIDDGGGGDRPAYFEAMTATLTRGWAPLRGVIAGRWKYIALPIPELYDLTADPGEQRNAVGADASRAAVLQKTLGTFDVAPPGRPGAETAAVRERLRALGYLGTSAPARDRYTEADDPKRLVELEQMIHRATEAWSRGQSGEAIALYRGVIARRPDTEDAYRYLAFVLWETGRPAEAIEALEAALRAGLTGDEIRIKLAQYLSDTGKAPRALAVLDGIDTRNPDALIAIGVASAAAGRLDAALAAFERAAAADPASGLARQNVGPVQLRRNDLAAAESSLRQAISLDPGLPGAHTALGVVLSRTGRRDAAIETWRQAASLSPSAFDALYNLAIALADAGRMDDARSYAARYIDTAPPALYAADIERLRRIIR